MSTSFQPSTCPNPSCEHHDLIELARRRRPLPRFYRHAGSFACAGRDPVRRFQCRTCGRHFSEQTFSLTYRQKKPEINADAERLLHAGTSVRSAARLLGIDRKTASRRFRWLARMRHRSRQHAAPRAS